MSGGPADSFFASLKGRLNPNGAQTLIVDPDPNWGTHGQRGKIPFMAQNAKKLNAQKQEPSQQHHLSPGSEHFLRRLAIPSVPMESAPDN